MSAAVVETARSRQGTESYAIPSTGVDIHVADWGAPQRAHAVVLLIPGTGGHGGYFGRFTDELRTRGYHPFSVDLRGHGRSGGARGVFTLQQWVENISDVARFLRRRTGLRVVLLGTSQGGEVAFHALQASDDVSAAVCHNILLSTERPLNLKVRLMQSRAVARLAELLPTVRIPLKLALDWRKVSLDPAFLEQKRRDPLAVWHYSLASYRSLFTTPPSIPPAGNHKPVLIAVGERDELVGPEHCLRCFMAIGGPKQLCVLPGAAHQLVLDYPEQFADVVARFLNEHLTR
ncbi:MAG: alpha/beta hydrolase [Myxococcota bacterium]